MTKKTETAVDVQELVATSSAAEAIKKCKNVSEKEHSAVRDANNIADVLRDQLALERRRSSFSQIKLIVNALQMMVEHLENNKNCPNIFSIMRNQTKQLNEIMQNY